MKIKHLTNLDRQDQKLFHLIANTGNISVLYADVVYEETFIGWLEDFICLMSPNGVIQIQTDFHTDYKWKDYLENTLGLFYVNDIIYKQEWGGTSKRWFPRKHDVIYIYALSKDYYFEFPKELRVEKVTAGTALDKGDGTKIPCDVFDDLGNFHTMAKERIKTEDGKNIKWQKSEKLMERLILPFSKPGDLIVDPMMGSGTTGRVALKYGRNFIGNEINKEIFDLAVKSMENI